jgi:hypothetical protein
MRVGISRSALLFVFLFSVSSLGHRFEERLLDENFSLSLVVVARPLQDVHHDVEAISPVLPYPISHFADGTTRQLDACQAGYTGSDCANRK